MALKNSLAKLVIDPAFRNPALLKLIFALDDATGIDLVRALAPIKLMPASTERFVRCFAHFIAGEELSFTAAFHGARLAPDAASRAYLQLQADEERAHLAHFRTKLAQFGLGEARLTAHVAPSFVGFGRVIDRCIERNDFVGVLVANNIIVENLAIVLLDLGCTDLRANSDEIAKFLEFVLRDERHHVRFGERRLRYLSERGAVDAAAVADLHGEMWELVERATDEIPDVLEAMSMTRAQVLDAVRRRYERAFGDAGVKVSA